MKRSTETVSLVLIGSVLAMAGCYSRDDDDERDGGRAGGVPLVMGRAISGGRSSGSVAPSVSARGGFGSSAYATVAG